GDALTLTARLGDGSALPAWLVFVAGRFTGTPPANFNGAFDIEVIASDGLASVSDIFRLTISAENDPPVLLAPLADIVSAEDQPIDIALPAGTFADVDGDGLTLSATLANGAALPAWLSFDGARFTGTPPVDFHGVLDLRVVASDGALSVSDVFRLTIDPVNDRPTLVAALVDVAGDEDVAIDVALPAGAFADVDGDALTLSARLAGGASLPAWLVFVAGRFTGTPPADFHGALDIEVTASDGTLSVADVFRLTIRPVNDAPVTLVPLADAVSEEDRAIDLVVPAGTFTDVDGDALILSATLAGGAALPTWLAFDGTRFTGTPPADFNGALDVVVTASDGSLSASSTFRLTITAVNDAPVTAALLPDRRALEDLPIDIPLPAGSFSDVDGDSLVLAATLADGGALPGWLSFDGTRFTGTPPANFNGALDIRVTASDGALSASDVFRLTIDPVNDRPTLQAALADAQGPEDVAVDVLVPIASFHDVDGDALTLSARLADGRALPAWLSFDGARFTGTPPANFNGFLDIEVLASDGALTVGDLFRLTITPVNDPPVVVAPLADAVAAEDRAIDIAVPIGTFADADGDALTLSALMADGRPLPAWLTFANGRLAGTPPADFNGTLDLAISASDGQVSATDTFRLTILAVNDAPRLGRLLADVRRPEDSAIDFALPADAFTTSTAMR
ncbi:tandem-95 repeat protein, partial [Sphingomonas parva]